MLRGVGVLIVLLSLLVTSANAEDITLGIDSTWAYPGGFINPYIQLLPVRLSNDICIRRMTVGLTLFGDTGGYFALPEPPIFFNRDRTHNPVIESFRYCDSPLALTVIYFNFDGLSLSEEMNNYIPPGNDWLAMVPFFLTRAGTMAAVYIEAIIEDTLGNSMNIDTTIERNSIVVSLDNDSLLISDLNISSLETERVISQEVVLVTSHEFVKVTFNLCISGESLLFLGVTSSYPGLSASWTMGSFPEITLYTQRAPLPIGEYPLEFHFLPVSTEEESVLVWGQNGTSWEKWWAGVPGSGVIIPEGFYTGGRPLYTNIASIVVNFSSILEIPPLNSPTISAYPNPFNTSTTFSYNLHVSGPAKLEIYDITGRLIKDLVDGYQEKGTHKVSWKGENQNGQKVPSGIYLVKLITNSQEESSKIILVK